MRRQTKLIKFVPPSLDSMDGLRYEERKVRHIARNGAFSPTEGGPAMATKALSPSARERLLIFEDEDRFPQSRFDPAKGILYGVLWGGLLWLVLILPFFW